MEFQTKRKEREHLRLLLDWIYTLSQQTENREWNAPHLRLLPTSKSIHKRKSYKQTLRFGHIGDIKPLKGAYSRGEDPTSNDWALWLRLQLINK